MAAQPHGTSITEVANQFGLFGVVALSLAALTILIALAGFYAFFDVRRTARMAAKDEAGRIAAEVAERVANTHMQGELPGLVSEYVEMAKSAATDEEGNRVAAAQDDSGEA